MAVHLRLMRLGRKKSPYYRIIAIDSRKPRESFYLEKLGYYQPVEGDKLNLDLEAIDRWIKKGAVPSLAVKNLIRRAKRSA